MAIQLGVVLRWLGTLGLLVLSVSACAPNIAYRTRISPAPGICRGVPEACPLEGWQLLSTTSRPVHLGFVEFDDQGALHRPDLKDELMARIRTLDEAHPLLIVVFAHGWKHNASSADTNVSDFASLLERIAIEDERVCAGHACEDRHVVGVYLGWRGLSASIEPFKELSFWTRKSRAHRVGADGAMEVLADLKKIDAGNDQGRLVLVGHSFGGALIFTAMQQQLMRDTAFLKSGSVAREGADLIVLVNPAFEAARFRALHRRVAGMIHSKTQRPILAVFTSLNDTATRRAFPLGRTLGTLTENHVSNDQQRENVTALGHYEPFKTHDLRMPKWEATGGHKSLRFMEYEEYGCTWQNFQAGATDVWSLGDLELSRRPVMQTDGQRRNPYINVSVDPNIISGHSDIWGEPFSQFLYRFIAVQSWRQRDTCAP